MGPQYFLGVYEQASKDGRDVLSIHLGENLSGVGNSARLAAETIGSNRVNIYDTGTVSMAQGLLAIAAEKAAAAGSSRKEIVAMLDEIKERTALRVITPNIPYIRASERVSMLKGILGTILKIDPILRIDHGEVKDVTKQRNMAGALNWMGNFVQGEGKMENVVILDFDAKKEADVLMKSLIEDSVPKEIIYRGELGMVTASHGGPGTIAMVTMRA